MSKGLKGITVKIDGDNKNLVKVLSGTEKEARSLSGELKGINFLLKFDPKNTELLAQKQTVLSQAIEQTESKLKMLIQAQQQMEEAGKNADNSAEYRDLQREIVATQQKLAGYNTQLEGTQKTQKTLNEALKDTENKGKALSDELDKINNSLKNDSRNTELLAQKQTVLKQAITETKEKLRLLAQEQQQMAEAGKDINDAGYRDLQREISATKQKLKGYNSELKGTETLGQKICKVVSHALIVEKLADGFTKAKQKIKETVKESEPVQKIGSAVESVKQKVEAFKDAHPKVTKVTEAFGKLKDTAGELKSRLPTLQQSLAAVGNAAAAAAKGGFKVLEVTIGGTMKAFAAFSTAALTAGAAITKNAVESYADYEQLVGGVETLFGAGGQSLEEYAQSVGKTTTDAQKEYDSLMKAQDTVLKNADKAYKDAGLSANEYMETITGFSSALIKSMGGDTEAAAQKADMAIIDMADNANKMGSDISSIQNAYQGFAKQNYTMLDNLKLGYGGTKEEMQRLLDDATKLSGIEYDISSYADIVDAIHVVQTEMGITGTTAEEASKTISGSISAAKSAYKNLMTGLANENANLDELIDHMTESVSTVVDNVLPRVMEIVPRIVETVPKLIEGLSATFAEIAGQLGGLAEQLLPPLIQAFFTLIRTVTSAFLTMLPQIINAAITLFSGILQGLNETIPQIMDMLPSLIQTISQTLIANLPQLVTAGTQILVNLINGITQTIPQLITAMIELIPVIVQTIMGNLPLIIDAGLNLLLSLVSGIVQAIPQLIAVLPQVITSIINTIIANLPKIIQTGIELLGALISGIILAIPSLIAALPQVFFAIINAFKGINWADLGKNIIDGVIRGVKNAARSLINVFTDLAKSALDAVKNFFGIASPSKVMRDQVGKMLPAGMAEGVEEGMDAEEKRIRAAMARGVPTTIDGYIKSGGGSHGEESVRTVEGCNIVQNLTINSPRELPPSETSRLNRIAMRQTILKLKPT